MNFGSKFVYFNDRNSDEEMDDDLYEDQGLVTATRRPRNGGRGGSLRSYMTTDSHSSNCQKVPKADTNIISIRFETIVQPSHMHTGDPIFCEKCSIILTKKSLIIRDSKTVDNDSQLKWICEFCSMENKHTMEIDEIPDSLDVTYMLQPAPTTTGMSVNNCQDNSMVIFCVDISGSMGITFPVNGRVQFKGYNDREAKYIRHLNNTGESQMLRGEKRNTTYVSRLQSVQAAIENQIIEMEKEHPNRRVAIVTFESEVMMIADDPYDTVIINNSDTLNDNKILFTIGQEFKTPKSIKENKKYLIDSLYDLEYKGTTALGPGLLASIGLASKVAGSKVILCTDGEANVGVGKLDHDADYHEFYLHAIKTANEFGVNVSVITIKDTECKLSEIGMVASETGGQVNIVDPLKLTQEFGNILADPVIATKVKATLFLHSGLHFCDEGDKNESKVEKIIGNVTKDTEITFQYGVRNEASTNKKKNVSKNVKNDNSSTSNTSKTSNLVTPEKKSENLNKLDTNGKPCQTTTENNEPTTTVTNTDSSTKEATKDASELPFQLQIEYNDLEGAKALRVITESKPITRDRKLAEKEMKWGVITSNLAQKTHKRLQQGDLKGGYLYNNSYDELMNRNRRGNAKKFSNYNKFTSAAISNLDDIGSKMHSHGGAQRGGSAPNRPLFDAMSDKNAHFAYNLKQMSSRTISDDEDDDDANVFAKVEAKNGKKDEDKKDDKNVVNKKNEKK